MFKHIGGLNLDENAPGWKHFTIHPRILESGLSCAKVTYRSIQGEIKVHWWIERVQTGPNRLHVALTVPPNTEATVFVPGEDEIAITETGVPNPGDPAALAPGVSPLPSEKEGIIAYQVQSGDYEFISVSEEMFPDSLQCSGGCCN